jgi:hypothetical protein
MTEVASQGVEVRIDVYSGFRIVRLNLPRCSPA